MKKFRILFVDDDRDILELVENYLSRFEYDITTTDEPMRALDLIMNESFDMVFTDYKMPEVDGIELLSAIKDYKPETVVVIVTGHGTMESAIEAMRYGSYDYIQKPFKMDVMKLLVDRVYEEKKLEHEAVIFRSRVKPRHKYQDLIGMNLKMQQVYEAIDRMKGHSPDVLIMGEIGTGKELTATVVHNTSDRSTGPFVPVKCSSLTEKWQGDSSAERISSLFETAVKGTLYFDEISDVPIDLQGVIHQMISRTKTEDGNTVGKNAMSARVIAASKKDLHESLETGAFHEDLYAHLDAVSLKMPALRERKEDICPLIFHFLDSFNAKHDRKIGGISGEAMDVLLAYHWPGNLIQLQSLIERAFALGVETIIQLDDLPKEIRTFGEISRNA